MKKMDYQPRTRQAAFIDAGERVEVIGPIIKNLLTDAILRKRLRKNGRRQSKTVVPEYLKTNDIDKIIYTWPRRGNESVSKVVYHIIRY